MVTTAAVPLDASCKVAIGEACRTRWSKPMIVMFSVQVPVTKIVTPRVLPVCAR